MEHIDEIMPVVRETPLFAEVEEAAARRFVERCPVRRYGAGTTLVRPSQEADRFFVILSGRVKVYKTSARGDQQTLHLYGPGATFGEAAMWAGTRFPAFADTLEETAVLVVPRDTLRGALAESPDLAFGMLAGLSAKLHEFARLIEDLSLKEVPARLAGVLLRMSAEQGRRTVRVSQSKRELAAQIGTVSATLSRALARLRKAGLIEVDGSRITLLDPDRLAEVAEEG